MLNFIKNERLPGNNERNFRLPYWPYNLNRSSLPPRRKTGLYVGWRPDRLAKTSLSHPHKHVHKSSSPVITIHNPRDTINDAGPSERSANQLRRYAPRLNISFCLEMNQCRGARAPTTREALTPSPDSQRLIGSPYSNVVRSRSRIGLFLVRTAVTLQVHDVWLARSFCRVFNSVQPQVKWRWCCYTLRESSKCIPILIVERVCLRKVSPRACFLSDWKEHAKMTHSLRIREGPRLLYINKKN